MKKKVPKPRKGGTIDRSESFDEFLAHQDLLVETEEFATKEIIADRYIIESQTNCDHLKLLGVAGFKRIGAWEPDETAGHIKCNADVTSEPALYAYVVDGNIKYIGSAQTGLRTRFRTYARTMRKRFTAYRIRQEILKAHTSKQRVEIFALVPPQHHWNGVPVNLVAGIEEGIIRAIKPEWNRRGKGRHKQSS